MGKSQALGSDLAPVRWHNSHCGRKRGRDFTPHQNDVVWRWQAEAGGLRVVRCGRLRSHLRRSVESQSGCVRVDRSSNLLGAEESTEAYRG
eukprot:scaffold36187_cov32-Tisochrysis_lutea.AAC.3